MSELQIYGKDVRQITITSHLYEKEVESIRNIAKYKKFYEFMIRLPKQHCDQRYMLYALINGIKWKL